jgi:peroxiredoxin
VGDVYTRRWACCGSFLLVVLTCWAFGISASAAPVASFTRSAAAGSPPLEVRFDANSSRDASGRIVLYQWGFGDGFSGSGATVTHRYATDGAYTVTLVVVNDQGARDLRSGLIHVSGATEVFWFGTEVGQAAPTFEMPGLDGKIVRISDFRGRGVLLEFWASTCGACTSSLPHLGALVAHYEAKGLALVGVTIESRAEDARRFLTTARLNMVCLFAPGAAGDALMDLYGVGTVPYTFLIDRIGVIRYSGSPGALSEKDIEPWL